MKKVLLYSGGMDSWLIDKLWKPDVKLYIDTGGSYSKDEIAKLPEDVTLFKLPIAQFEQENKFLPMRNLYFLMVASNFGDTLCLGAVRGDWNLNDKNPTFLRMAESMLNYLWETRSANLNGKQIEIEREFLMKSKVDLVREFKEKGGDLKELYEKSISCYQPKDGCQCWGCKPCFRKFVAMAANGWQFNDEERRKMYEYVRREVVPLSKVGQGTYYTQRPGEGEYARIVVEELYKEFKGDLASDRRAGE